MMALITGAASCGKSAYAEKLCTSWAAADGCQLVYMAAMDPSGVEGARRVARHRAARASKGFATIECCSGLEAACQHDGLDGACVLFESLGTLVANELFAPVAPGAGQGEAAFAGGRELAADHEVLGRIEAALEMLFARARHVVIVGEEVGSDALTHEGQTQRYIELLGALSRTLARRSDAVVEVAAGIACTLKGAALLGEAA